MEEVSSKRCSICQAIFSPWKCSQLECIIWKGWKYFRAIQGKTENILTVCNLLISQVYLDTPLMKEIMFGVYGHPDKDDCLMINDLDLAKRMLIKDFDHFVDRGDFGLKLDPHDEIDKIFANTFLLMKGDQWKTTRNLITPVFSTGKMKLMFPLIRKVG